MQHHDDDNEVDLSEEPAASTEAVRAQHPAPIVTGIVAGTSLAAMAVTGSLALARNEVAKDPNGEMAWAARMTARDEAVQLGVVADVSLGIGIAASVATVIALLATRKPKASVMLVPAGPAGDGPGITLSGHFGRRGAR